MGYVLELRRDQTVGDAVSVPRTRFRKCQRGTVMTMDHQHPYDWRERTIHLASKLDRAHSRVEDLGAALDEGDGTSARQIMRSAQEALGSAAEAVKTFTLSNHQRKAWTNRTPSGRH